MSSCCSINIFYFEQRY